MPRILLGVAGRPVSHSRSPAMHNAALAELGLDWLYVPLPLPEDLFPQTVRALAASGFRGLNVTVPHKLAARELADSPSEAVRAIGAANTLTFEAGAILAENTDAGGFLDALGESPAGRHALVLGAGGSARAVVWALREAGAAEVSICNRTAGRAAALARELGARQVERPVPADLLVNCTSVGLDPRTGRDEVLAALALDALQPPPVVVDLVYRDGPTPLLDWASAAGATAVDGREVLVRQGARSLRVWTSREPPLAVMRAALG